MSVSFDTGSAFDVQNLSHAVSRIWEGIIVPFCIADTTQNQYSVNTIHSGNLYQIFTYVKNKDAAFGDQPHTVSGMLLYAQTDEIVQPNHVYHMSGNKITVRTLDLNQPFSQIAAQLDSIVVSHFE